MVSSLFFVTKPSERKIKSPFQFVSKWSGYNPSLPFFIVLVVHYTLFRLAVLLQTYPRSNICLNSRALTSTKRFVTNCLLDKILFLSVNRLPIQELNHLPERDRDRFTDHEFQLRGAARGRLLTR